MLFSILKTDFYRHKLRTLNENGFDVCLCVLSVFVCCSAMSNQKKWKYQKGVKLNKLDTGQNVRACVCVCVKV